MARGGARSGKPGANYQNRTDLQSAPRLAPTAAQGQPYGEAGQQLNRQAQIPMGMPAPAPIPMNAPTSRLGEPVQAGLSMGPGPGPESIPALSQTPATDPDIATFAPYIGSLELLSSLPNASSATRNLIRRLRSSIPATMPTSTTPEAPTP